MAEGPAGHLSSSDRAVLGDLIDAELTQTENQLAGLGRDFDAIVEEEGR